MIPIIFIGFVIYSLRQWETWSSVAVMIWIILMRRGLLSVQLTMYLTVYPFLNTAPPYSHYLTKNLLHFKNIYSVEPGMGYFPEKVYSDYSGQWNIIHHGKYKVITNKDSDVKYFLLQCSTEPPEDAHYYHQFSLSVNFQGGILVTEMTQIPHLEHLGLRSEIKAFVVNPKYIFAHTWKV